MKRLIWVTSFLLIAVLPNKSAENPVVENARSHPGSFTANHLAGEHLLKSKDFGSAITYLEKAWKIDPANYVNGYDLALVYLDTGAAEKSRQVIETLLQQNDKAELHNLLGDVEEAEGHVNEAARQYELAARSDPSEKHLFDLGSDLLKHRSFDPALKVFEFGVERYNDSAMLRTSLGVAYYSVGRYDDAVETLCRAVDLNPNDTRALDFLGKMYDVSPHYAAEVTKRLARFVSLYPQNSSANYYYGLALRKRTSGEDVRSDQDKAERYLLKAAKLSPDFVDAYLELGQLYEDQGRDREAIQQYELAVRLQPDLPRAHYHLARLYQKSGNKILAQKEFALVKSLKVRQ